MIVPKCLSGYGFLEHYLFLSSERESQIVVTIGTLLHHIHVEF